MMFTNVLAAVDLGQASASFVLEKAATYVATGGVLHVAHIVEPQYVQYSFDPTFTGSLTRSLEEDALVTARSRLEELCKPLGIPTECQHVALGRTSDRIHALALETGAEVIVIGSHAQHGWRRLLGSTATAVLHGAPVDVIVLRMSEGAP